MAWCDGGMIPRGDTLRKRGQPQSPKKPYICVLGSPCKIPTSLDAEYFLGYFQLSFKSVLKRLVLPPPFRYVHCCLTTDSGSNEITTRRKWDWAQLYYCSANCMERDAEKRILLGLRRGRPKHAAVKLTCTTNISQERLLDLVVVPANLNSGHQEIHLGIPTPGQWVRLTRKDWEKYRNSSLALLRHNLCFRGRSAKQSVIDELRMKQWWSPGEWRDVTSASMLGRTCLLVALLRKSISIMKHVSKRRNSAGQYKLGPLSFCLGRDVISDGSKVAWLLCSAADFSVAWYN